MNEHVTESSHAQCEPCRILKTVRMTEQSANHKRNLGSSSRCSLSESVSQGSDCCRTSENF